MATPTKKRAGVSLPDIDRQAPKRDGITISAWRSAVRQAEQPRDPSRVKLIDIYGDIMTDPHLTAAVEKRIEDVKGCPLTFSTGGKPNDKISALMAMPFFTDMLGDILEAKFYGYSAAWIDLSGGEFRGYELLDRRHVLPEKAMYVYRAGDRQGVAIKEMPYANYVITAGERLDLGMLLKAVPWVLLKRGDISDWATFNEMFSMPFRLGSYPAYNAEAKKELVAAMQQLGSNGWGVKPSDVELEFINGNAQNGGNGYLQFAEVCDKQISKLFLHSTMTMDSEGGQYKGETHERSESKIHMADRRAVAAVLNTEFKRLLEAHGFAPGDGVFAFENEDHLCLKDRMAIDRELSEIIDIPAEYFYTKYGIPTPNGGAKLKPRSASVAMSTALAAEAEVDDQGEALFFDPKPRKRKAFGFFG